MAQEKADEQKKQDQEKKVEEPQHPALTAEQTTYLKSCVDAFLGKFMLPSSKDTSIKQLKLVFNMIKNPNSRNIAENFKTIQMTNEKFKQIREAN